MNSEMTSREIIRRIISHNEPPRIGLDFLGDNPTDFLKQAAVRLAHPVYSRYAEWGREPYLMNLVPGFSGEVKMTSMGNIFGRFDEKTQGECIKGALQDGWQLFESYSLPQIDEAFNAGISALNLRASEKYVLGSFPFAVFSASGIHAIWIRLWPIPFWNRKWLRHSWKKTAALPWTLLTGALKTALTG